MIPTLWPRRGGRECAVSGGQERAVPHAGGGGPGLARLAPIIEAGEAATCAIIDLEVLFSVRNYTEHERNRARRQLAYVHVPLTEGIFQRAIAVQGELAKLGQHRLPIPDLIVAAAGEAAGLAVLHYDADFDRIAAVTGQPVEWVVRRGSV